MNLETAIQIAAEAHSSQLDKGGTPYILHPLYVMMQMETIEEKTVAILHDVVEDTNYTLQDLEDAGFFPFVIGCVDNLTKRRGETNMEYLNRVKSHPISCRVKIADIKHNMDVTRLPDITLKDTDRLCKYHWSLQYLEKEDG